MVDVYRTEDEQVEYIKKWWSENGTALVAIVCLVSAVTFAYQFWQGRQEANKSEASMKYQEIIDIYDAAKGTADGQLLSEVQLSTAKHLTEGLKSKFGSSQYAHYASMMLAKQAVLAKDFKKAEEELRAVLANDPDDSLRSLVTLRLSKVLFSQGLDDEAMTILKDTDAGALKAGYEEIKGDIFLAKNDRTSARESYQRAKALYKEVGISVNRMMQMKLDALAEPDSNLIFDQPVAVTAPATIQEETSAPSTTPETAETPKEEG